MDCEPADSKIVIQVFDASKRKKSKKKNRDAETLSVEDLNSIPPRKSSVASLQELSTAHGDGPPRPERSPQRQCSSTALQSSQFTVHSKQHHSMRSPRRHRKPHRGDLSLALNAGLFSTPRSSSPLHDSLSIQDTPVGNEQDSMIYALLEEQLRKDKDRRRTRNRKYEQARHDNQYVREKDHDCVKIKDDDRAWDRTRDRERDYERDRDYDCDRERDRGRERGHGRHRHRNSRSPGSPRSPVSPRSPRDHDRERDHDHEQERDRNRDRDRDCEKDRERDRERDRDFDKNREGDKERSGDQGRDRHRERSRERDRDRERDRERDQGSRNRARGSDRERSSTHEHRRHRHHRRRRDEDPLDYDKPELKPSVDQSILLDTFAKIFSTLSERTTQQLAHSVEQETITDVVRSQSHKSLQCQVEPVIVTHDVDQQPVRLHTREPSREHVTVTPSYSRVRSPDPIHETPSRLRVHPDKCHLPTSYDKNDPNFLSKIEAVASKMHDIGDRYHAQEPNAPNLTRSCIDHSYKRARDCRLSKHGDERRHSSRDRRLYEEEKYRCEEKMSRSFDLQREPYDAELLRRTARSESIRKNFDEMRLKDGYLRYNERDRRYDGRRERYEERDRERDRHINYKDRGWRRMSDRFERGSLASRSEEHVRERDRDRDSCVSVVDDTSTLSGRSNYLKVVKQGILDQREAMEQMMKLWKELMRCFKTLSHGQPHADVKDIQDSAAHVRESAEAQLQLWRECMRRYETVARDVGDTDARLMEEIQKQRSEMAEMTSVWQECLQRYRDMSNDFNTLKKQLGSENPVGFPGVKPSMPMSPAPPPCVEGEPAIPPHVFRVPGAYPMHPSMAIMNYGRGGGPEAGMHASHRTQSSALPPPPPPWWAQEPPPARRRSSPDSVRHSPREASPRGSRDRDHRRRHKDRDDSHYKEKSSNKHHVRRSDHRRKKR